MDAVRKIIENSSNPLTIQLPDDYLNKKLEVIVLPIDEAALSAKKYNFSGLAGHLEWKGDPLSQQRKLRDEWE
jgi:transcriptional regulator of NAD metabolism